MGFIKVENPRTEELLRSNHIPWPTFEKILSTVQQANSNYYQLSEIYEHFHKMLSSNEMMLNNYAEYRVMPQKEKLEWVKIKDLKTGDRGYVNRHLISELKEVIPDIFEELLKPQLAAQASSLDLSAELDALLLGSSVPAYFEYLEKLTIYKKGVFSQLRRGYISFLQVKAIHLLSHYLKAFEQDQAVLQNALLSDHHLQAWPRMGQLVSQICDRVDPNHHDPLSLHAVNCLRSIYVSTYNMARKITFLMLTTVNDKASIVEAISTGVRGYLIKPFSRKQLLEKVYFATEWLRKEQQSDRST